METTRDEHDGHNVNRAGPGDPPVLDGGDRLRDGNLDGMKQKTPNDQE
jgi:hypothetical protein